MKKLLIGIILSLLFLKTPKAIDGIDVSAWQGEINFNEVAKSGIEIVYIRASAGDSYKDEYFEQNYTNAKNAGLKVGFYHYLTARTVEEAQTQARFFASIIASKSADCKIAMDYESFPGLTKEEINNISRAFLETLKNLINKELIIYSDLYNARNTFDSSLFTEYPLWLAEYDVDKPGITNYEGWQYSDVGRIPGINGNVDRDTFNDSIYLSDVSQIQKPVINDKDKSKTIYYRVKNGDNLTKIAHKYNTTVSKIISLNNLINPNLIFPDEVLKIETNYDYKITNTGNKNTYTVKKGDNLTKIAKKNNCLVSNLVTWNNIKNPNLIYINQVLIIKPRTNEHLIKYVVKKGDTLEKIAKCYKTTIYELIIINKITNKNNISSGCILYIPPTYIFEKDK